jgi:hypothetical protein
MMGLDGTYGEDFDSGIVRTHGALGASSRRTSSDSGTASKMLIFWRNGLKLRRIKQTLTFEFYG